ncbi:MAG: VIT domain-containing protein [Pseudomonadota bacterium]
MKRMTTFGMIVGAMLMCSAALAQPLLVPTDGSVRALDMEYYRVETKVVDGVASADVKMGFRNHTSRQLEATFIFPLPEGASIGKFRMEMMGKWVEGQVLEKNEAKRIYTEIVRTMKDPGLLELVGKDLFQARVFPVPANGVQRIEMSFATSLKQESGTYQFIYPLKTARNFSGTVKDFTFTLKLESKTPLRSVYSPSHKVRVKRKGDHEAVVGFEQQGAAFAQDLQVFYSVDYNDVGLSVLSYRKKGDPGYFMILAAPGAKDTADEVPDKKIVFVVDTSGSMQGEKMERVKAALKYAIERLGDGDRFNIVRFSSDVESVFPAMKKAGGEARKEALGFIDSMEAAGGTAIDDALATALGGVVESDTLVIFLTDGEPTVGETDPARIAKNALLVNKLGARIFPFGVGSDLNTTLLDELARDHHGSPTYLRPDKDIEKTLSAFYDKISHPVLSNIKLHVPAAKAYGILPGSIPDLFRGEQLVIVGRYRAAGSTLIRLEGTLGGKKKTYDFEAKLPEDERSMDFIPRLWAKRQVGMLLEQIRIDGEKQPLVDEIIQLGTTYGIVTPYTSYLITEPGYKGTNVRGPMRPGARRGEGRALDGLMGGEFGGSGGDGAPMAEATAAEAPSDDMGLMMDAEEMKKDSGKKAVRVSQTVAKMKSAEVANTTGGTVREVGDKTFNWKDGGWMDEAATSGKRIKVKPYSQAYFDLAKASKLLASYLALGDKVTFEWKGFIIEIADDGVETLPADLQKKL